MKRLLVIALALAGCASDLGGQFSAVAVTYDPKADPPTFKFAQVRINTLTSLRNLQGTSGNVTSGGVIAVKTSAVSQPGATVASLRALFIQQPSSQVQLTWNLIGPVVYVEDFASLELLSTYYNMEKARLLLATYGVASLAPQPIDAHAALADETGNSPLDQGEMYYAPLATYYPPDPTPQAQVPAALNDGAVAHALMHQAINDLVWGGAPVPSPEQGTDPVGKHLERSFTEGMADYLGTLVSDDVDWTLRSQSRDAAARTLDQGHCGTADMLSALSVDDASQPYDPYPLGSVIAQVLFDEGSATTQQVTARNALNALSVVKSDAQSVAPTLAQYLDALTSTASSDQQPDLCGMIINRFAPLGITASSLPSCTAPVAHPDCQ